MSGESSAPLYPWLVRYFNVSIHVFYSTVETRGVSNVPKPGVPTIVCFNHGNGLVDAALLMIHTPRVLRFCAKDVLWNIPFWGALVRNSGAVPVSWSGDEKIALHGLVGDSAGELETGNKSWFALRGSVGCSVDGLGAGVSMTRICCTAWVRRMQC